MNNFKIRVKILEIGEVEQISDNFEKREVVGVLEGEYPEYFKFEFQQNKKDEPEVFAEGTYATIHFNLRGRKVESKKDKGVFNYFTTLVGWKIEK